jgi:hypothetical protein
MTATCIPVIMDLVDKIISEDRKRKYSNALVVKILLIIQMYGISYRSTEKFFNNHPDLKEAICLNEIPNFRTLSRRARMIDWHYVNAMILDLISTEKENAAIDSFIVNGRIPPQLEGKDTGITGINTLMGFLN